MRHGTVRIKLLIKSTLRKRAPPTHSVAAITLGCPRSSPRFPPLPGQPVSRPARPPAAAARTPCDFLCAPRPPVRPTTAACVPSRAAAASTPYCRPHAPWPPARSAAAARAPRRGRRLRLGSDRGGALARPAAEAAHTPRLRLGSDSDPGTGRSRWACGSPSPAAGPRASDPQASQRHRSEPARHSKTAAGHRARVSAY
jgi:hypothetical protein